MGVEDDACSELVEDFGVARGEGVACSADSERLGEAFVAGAENGVRAGGAADGIGNGGAGGGVKHRRRQGLGWGGICSGGGGGGSVGGRVVAGLRVGTVVGQGREVVERLGMRSAERQHFVGHVCDPRVALRVLAGEPAALSGTLAQTDSGGNTGDHGSDARISQAHDLDAHASHAHG